MVGRCWFSIYHAPGLCSIDGKMFVGWVFNPEWLLNNGCIVIFNGLLIETFPLTMGHVVRPVFQEWGCCFVSWPMGPVCMGCRC